MKTNPRETSENVIRLVNKKYNIDMVRDNCEIAVYARIYLAKKLSMINMSQKYIASIFDVSKTTIGRMITLYGYDRDKYIQYRDKFKKTRGKRQRTSFHIYAYIYRFIQ